MVFFFFLKVLKDGLSTLNVPYSYGFAIILLTVLVKAVTFPLTKKQVLNTNSIISYSKNIIYIYIFFFFFVWLFELANCFFLCCCLKVESAMSMRSLQPQVKAIQQRYAGDQVENFVFSILNMLTTIGIKINCIGIEPFLKFYGLVWYN